MHRCKDITKYEFISKIGQGTYGEIWKAKTANNKIVAVKKVVTNKYEGFPQPVILEIKILKELKHENIVQLIEVCRSKIEHENNFLPTTFLIYEFCDYDLAEILSNIEIKFLVAEIKQIIKMLFQGLFFMHKNKLLHRDLRPANIFITKTGLLKLADFSSARTFKIKKNNLTNPVVALWYRSPELLLGARNYGPAIDIWAAGCIMAELWTRIPIMQGSTEQGQLNYIIQLCGSITPDVWPDADLLSLYGTFKLAANRRRIVFERLAAITRNPYACSFLDKLLVLDPAKRIDAENALNNDFFWVEPLPIELDDMILRHSDILFDIEKNKMCY